MPIKVWRGKHRATNGTCRVRRVTSRGKLLPFHTHEQHKYTRGNLPPNYPVPAIPLRAVWGTDYMWDTVYIERSDETDPVIVAICDMNFDRCLDFDTPWCEFYRP